MTLKILHLSTYDAGGGAARAAYALHRAMIEHGLMSRMWVARKGTSDQTVRQRGRLFWSASEADRLLWKLQSSPVETWRSPAVFSSLSAKEINASTADVVHLHWVTNGYLSIEQIGKIDKPVVWSMYDMWPFTGTEHYAGSASNARWRIGYTRSNRPVSDSAFDLNRWAYERKIRSWALRGRRVHMVPASSWLERATRSSALMHDWPITRIPHVVNPGFSEPFGSETSRERLGIPDVPTILFVSSGGIRDKRKGFDLLEAAMPSIIKHKPNAHLIIAGPAESGYTPPVNMRMTWLGNLSTDEDLRHAYSAADVLVVPSREDNLPLTALEAQVCGTLVVSSTVGGLPDIVEDHVTGRLVDVQDAGALALAIVSQLDYATESTRDDRVKTASSKWSSSAVTRAYEKLYERISSSGP